MKRLGVWTLVALIAILDVGYVRPGLAQSDGFDLGVPISGASGRSVHENVWLVSWDWTAPATGPVTFDTDGSDFDMVLTVLDANGTTVASNVDGIGDGSRFEEVRFTAQQGQAYRIAAVRFDGSVDRSTVVLNWQQSSTGSPGDGNGGGNRVSPDDFASSTAISGASGRREASNVDASKEGGEPDHAGNDGGASLWWTWTAPATGPVTFDTSGSDFDTLLAVYTGSSVSRLTEVASNDDSGGNAWSGVRFSAQQGRAYHIAVDGWDGDSGAIVLNWQAASDSGDDFASATAISGASGRHVGTNVGAGIETGEPRHSGDDGGASVWWTWTAPAAGIVTFDTLGSDFDTLLAVYTGASLKRLVEVGSNDDASKTTYQSAVRFSARRGQAYHVAVDGYGGATGAIVLNWQSASGNGADAFRSRGALIGASGRRDGSNVGAGLETGEPNHASKSGGASVWWTWTAPATGEVTFDTRGSSIDTLLAVYTGTHLNRLTPVASNDDASSGGRQSTVSFRAQQGRTYHVVVDGYGGATGAIVLNWRVADEAAEERDLPAGRIFRDCPHCPEMVVVPSGSFIMGSPVSEAGRKPSEGPQHWVTIAVPFAVGVYEVTKEEFAHFVAATNRVIGNSCYVWGGNRWVDRIGVNWQNPGYHQTGRHPVVCISWEDMQAYVEWLSQQTGKRYRLPSEAEWEYVARGGTRTARYWGESTSPQCWHANGSDVGCDDGYKHTAPVGSFTNNGFGLYDVLGNVVERLQDCWHDNYEGAPRDGRAWERGGDCSSRVSRGGSWFWEPSYLRSSSRIRGGAKSRGDNSGFRVVRELTP